MNAVDGSYVCPSCLRNAINFSGKDCKFLVKIASLAMQPCCHHEVLYMYGPRMADEDARRAYFRARVAARK